MADFVLRTTDLLEVTLPGPIIPELEMPLPLVGSSTDVTVGGEFVCLQGDEVPAVLRAPLVYTQLPYTEPGTGTLTLLLPPENLTQQTTNGGKPLLVAGGTFDVVFMVETPAMQLTPAGILVPDPVVEKPGTACFVTTNALVTAS
ncbi:hypothetical protein [Streptacidiphilus anmyonensis]|uniref:hypothetical protein n=1 Tax=Streptacidiphilus anmyonensis TaxID=405782 RepID=UPI000693D60B|nr:hypothetical protein [Streptacidiphilus anmyonensis]